MFPPTIVIRHARENLKKCSLSGLEKREDFRFYTYPLKELVQFPPSILLSFEGELLSEKDSSLPLLILDGTWRYAEKMEKHFLGNTIKRSLPSAIVTAYPRRQEGCISPERGLSSIEAIFIAYQILGRPTDGLLDNYYWKQKFFELNRSHLL